MTRILWPTTPLSPPIGTVNPCHRALKIRRAEPNDWRISRSFHSLIGVGRPETKQARTELWYYELTNQSKRSLHPTEDRLHFMKHEKMLKKKEPASWTSPSLHFVTSTLPLVTSYGQRSRLDKNTAAGDRTCIRNRLPSARQTRWIRSRANGMSPGRDFFLEKSLPRRSEYERSPTDL
jgi:hypothetical protein